MTTTMNQTLGFAQQKRDGKPNGIHFGEEGTRTLWLADQQIASGTLAPQPDLYAYFYELRFLDDFPQITHWTFGSAWTQQVKIERPKASADELMGKLFFASDDDLGIYIIERSYETLFRNAPIVQTPLPKLFDQPLNIPLRVLIAQMLIAALDDDLPYDQWHFVTSLLPREEVAEIFTTDMAATYGFRIKALPNDLRQALCELQAIPTGEKR